MKLRAVPDLPEVRPGDDLAELVAARADLQADDVVCAASTVVSKAEGRTAALDDFPAGPRARELAADLSQATGSEVDPRFVQAVLVESTEVLFETPFLLTETRCGHVGVNAGIDKSNVAGADLLLLPTRPSEAAARLREALGVSAVVVTDTSGRPFRHGQRGVAVGWDGLPAGRDYRGEPDRDGREMSATVENVVDELAAAANLVSGEGAEGTPVVVIEGFRFGDHAGSDAHFRDVPEDLVRQAIRGWDG